MRQFRCSILRQLRCSITVTRRETRNTSEERPQSEEDIIELIVGEEYIDHYGHVNYLSSPRIFEKGQDAFMERRGVGFDAIEEQYGLRSVVRRLDVNYPGQIFPGDVVIVHTSATVGNTSITYYQWMEREREKVVESSMVVVMMDLQGNKQRVPESVRGRLLPTPK